MPNENERMNWGMEKAKLTLHYFKKCLQTPKDGQLYFSIKARVEDQGKIEHIWLSDPSFESENSISGIIGNEPIDVTNVKMGQKITITKEFVSDWMIIENGRLIGGYTIRAIREGYSGLQLENFDKSLGGMIVDYGEDYFIPSFDTPEGAILLLEQAYDEDDIEKAMACKNFHKEAEFMLQKSLQIPLDDEIISKTGETLKLSFISHMQSEGMPKFHGVKRAFRRQKITNDHYIITEICYHPDGKMTVDKLHTFKTDTEWKVLQAAE